MTDIAPPPADAVARDPHWKAKLERAKNRAPMRRSITLTDDDAHTALQDAKMQASVALEQARQALLAEHADLDPADRAVAVEEGLPGHEIVVAAGQAVDDAQAAVDEADITFTFQAIPVDVYEELVGQHPPTDEQVKRGETYNIKTFAPALLAASSVEDMTAEDAATLIGGEVVDPDTGKSTTYRAVLSQGEASILFSTCIAINEGARASLGKG